MKKRISTALERVSKRLSCITRTLREFFPTRRQSTQLNNHQNMFWKLLLAIHAFTLLWQTLEGGLEIEPRTLLIEPSSMERQGGQKSQVTFICLQVVPNRRPHRPPQHVVWMKDGQVIVAEGTRKYRHYRQKKWLEINDLNEMDSGLYECAMNVTSSERGRAELWVAPRILSAPNPQTLVLNKASSLECLVTGGRRTVDWWRNGLIIASTDPSFNNTDSRYSITSTGSLLISPVTRHERALYSCIAKNPAGHDRKDIRVRVKAGTLEPVTDPMPDTPYTFPPWRNLSHCEEYSDIRFDGEWPLVSLSSSLTDAQSTQFRTVPHACAQTRVGYRIVLSCTAKGSPAPVVHWTKDGQTLQVSYTEQSDGVPSQYYQLSNGSLMIRTVQLSDAGNYTCTATNGLGHVTTSVQLEVRGEMEQCGVKGQSAEVRRARRIVQGFAVSGIHEWPWQALIEYEADWLESLLPTLFCGGALIRSDWILTAAHCLFRHYDGQQRSDESLVVRVGVYNRTHDMESHQQLLKVQRTIIHPSYSPTTDSPFAEHDIALIQLAKPIRPSSQVGTVCLPPHTHEPAVGSVCTVTGWGRLQQGLNEYPELLHQGDVPLASHSECTSHKSYGRKVTDNMLCAGWKDGGTDACQNDSGGPVVCEVPGNEGRWALYGIVNYGHGCGAPDKYGVYARVTKYLSWIHNTMSS